MGPSEWLGVTIDPTNVHVLFLQQELFFESCRWAQLAEKKPMGLAQRCLSNFGAEMTTSEPEWTGFFKQVCAPILEAFFGLFVQRLGPRATALEKLALQLSEPQRDVKLYMRRPCTGWAPVSSATTQAPSSSHTPCAAPLRGSPGPAIGQMFWPSLHSSASCVSAAPRSANKPCNALLRSWSGSSSSAWAPLLRKFRVENPRYDAVAA